jgi:hypothetical protein
MPTIDLSKVIKGGKIKPKPQNLRSQREEARRIEKLRTILSAKKPKPDWNALSKIHFTLLK